MQQAIDNHRLSIFNDHELSELTFALTLMKSGKVKESFETFDKYLQFANPKICELILEYKHAGIIIQSNKNLQKADKLYMVDGNFEKAIQYYDRVDFELCPDDIVHRCHHNKAVCLAQTGHLKEAVQEFNEALRVIPSNCESQENLAFVFMELKQFDHALHLFDQILRNTIHPHSNPAHIMFWRTDCLLRLGRFEEAKSAAQFTISQTADQTEQSDLTRQCRAQLQQILTELHASRENKEDREDREEPEVPHSQFIESLLKDSAENSPVPVKPAKKGQKIKYNATPPIASQQGKKVPSFVSFPGNDISALQDLSQLTSSLYTNTRDNSPVLSAPAVPAIPTAFTATAQDSHSVKEAKEQSKHERNSRVSEETASTTTTANESDGNLHLNIVEFQYLRNNTKQAGQQQRHHARSPEDNYFVSAFPELEGRRNRGVAPCDSEDGNASDCATPPTNYVRHNDHNFQQKERELTLSPPHLSPRLSPPQQLVESPSSKLSRLKREELQAATTQFSAALQQVSTTVNVSNATCSADKAAVGVLTFQHQKQLRSRELEKFHKSAEQRQSNKETVQQDMSQQLEEAALDSDPSPEKPLVTRRRPGVSKTNMVDVIPKFAQPSPAPSTLNSSDTAVLQATSTSLAKSAPSSGLDRRSSGRAPRSTASSSAHSMDQYIRPPALYNRPGKKADELLSSTAATATSTTTTAVPTPTETLQQHRDEYASKNSAQAYGSINSKQPLPEVAPVAAAAVKTHPGAMLNFRTSRHATDLRSCTDVSSQQASPSKQERENPLSLLKRIERENRQTHQQQKKQQQLVQQQQISTSVEAGHDNHRQQNIPEPLTKLLPQRTLAEMQTIEKILFSAPVAVSGSRPRLDGPEVQSIIAAIDHSGFRSPAKRAKQRATRVLTMSENIAADTADVTTSAVTMSGTSQTSETVTPTDPNLLMKAQAITQPRLSVQTGSDLQMRPSALRSSTTSYSSQSGTLPHVDQRPSWSDKSKVLRRSVVTSPTSSEGEGAAKARYENGGETLLYDRSKLLRPTVVTNLATKTDHQHSDAVYSPRDKVQLRHVDIPADRVRVAGSEDIVSSPSLMLSLKRVSGSRKVASDLTSLHSTASSVQATATLDDTRASTTKPGHITRFYTLKELQAPGPYPPEVHLKYRELYLDDEAFRQALGVDKQEWENLPVWKQTNKKKAVGLF